MKKIKRYLVEKEGWHIIRSYMQFVEWNVSILDCWCRQTASPAIDIVSVQYIMHDYKYSTEEQSWSPLHSFTLLLTVKEISIQQHVPSRTQTITTQLHPLISAFTFIPNQPTSILNLHYHHLLPSNPNFQTLMPCTTFPIGCSWPSPSSSFHEWDPYAPQTWEVDVAADDEDYDECTFLLDCCCYDESCCPYHHHDYYHHSLPSFQCPASNENH